MKFKLQFAVKSAVHTQVVGAIITLTALSAVWGGAAHADSAHDAVAKLNELSQQTEELAEAMQSTQLDLDKKLQLLSEADKGHANDLARLDTAKAELATQQSAVNKVAAAAYVGGRTDDLNAILTAASPSSLIDNLAIQRVVTTEMSARMASFGNIAQEAQAIEEASAKSAADARAATDEATAIRADLLNKQSQLRAEVKEVNAQFALLPSSQRTAAVPASVMAALGLRAPIPTVGMAGLVPNARSLVHYIMTTYPGVQSIGGVRADWLPDHPSGRAIDIMIGSNMGLGDAINADIQGQGGRFGVSYTMWRVANHFDHIHVTVF